MPAPSDYIFELLLAIGGGIFAISITVFAIALPQIREIKRGRTELTIACIIASAFCFCTIGYAAQVEVFFGFRLDDGTLVSVFMLGPILFAGSLIYSMWILSAIDDE